MANVTDTWIVDLKLNTTSFQRGVNDVKKQVQSAAGNMSTSVSSSFKASIGDVGSSLTAMIKGDIGNSVTDAFQNIAILGSSKLFDPKRYVAKFKKLANIMKTFGQQLSYTAAGWSGTLGNAGVALGDAFALTGKFLFKALSNPEILAAAAAITTVAVSIGALALAATTAGPVMAGFALGMLNFSRPFLQAYADVQKLEFGLTKIGATAAQVKSTLELGKLPGLNRQQAAESTTKFAAAGFSIEESQALTVAFSKGAQSAEQYGRIITSLSQILSKGKLSQEELTQQLGEAVPGFQQILQKTFGMNAEELVASGMDVNSFVVQLARYFDGIKTPVNSAQSALDNFDDSIQKLQASFGKGMAGTLLPFLDILSSKIDDLASSGKLEAIGERFANFAQGIDVEAALNGLIQMGDALATIANRLTDVVNLWNSLGKATEVTGSLLSGLGDFLANLIPGVGPAKQLIDTGLKYQEAKRLANGSSNNAAAGVSKVDGIFNKASQVLKNMTTKPANDTGTGGTINSRNEMMKKQLEALREISKNTSPDLQKSILGGGNLGAKGVSLLDLTNRKNRNSGSGYSAKVLGLFDQMMAEIMKDFNNAQQKMLTTRGGF